MRRALRIKKRRIRCFARARRESTVRSAGHQLTNEKMLGTVYADAEFRQILDSNIVRLI